MDSAQVIARFEAERQALALMDHPNIARVLDAGTTDTGRPYFVMELVKGVPITEFCDRNRLTLRERLELFVPVCQAIQHAHQKGIIHRDVKPSNVLVTLYDGKPVPKVIDFGVAKAIDQQLTEKTLFTRFGAIVGTLEYMSPEQAELGAMTDTLMETYLGRDAGRRVLSGKIVRGIAERIDAVVWFSDLRGFTRITDTTPEQVIPLLNDYFDVIVSAIKKYGGDVLKLIGDGTLAIFTAGDRMQACDMALAAALAARQGIAELKKLRAQADKPVTDMYLGLHVGEVFFGNVGSRERLDFTVVGPAVNEASRIAAMCRSLEQPVLISAAFADVGNLKQRLVSVGRYALRGVSHAQELFTLDPDA